MKVSKAMVIMIGALVSAVVFSGVQPVWAQARGASPDPRDALFARLRDTAKKLGPNAILTGGARSLFSRANNWNRIKAETARASVVSPGMSMMSALMPGLISARPDLVQTATGQPSRLRAFTANESSTAWCGNNVVVGFNDTESEVESTPPNLGNVSIGYSVSNDNGASFTDQGFPAASGNPFSSLGFDQVMTCASAKNFYFSSLYNFLDGSFVLHTAVSLSASSDGGKTFGPPTVAVAKLGGPTNHFIDSDWMAIDPSDPQRLFITYTDDDLTGTVCPGALGTSIELVSSNDGGATWSTPVKAAKEVCSNPSSLTPGLVAFSGVAVDPRGTAAYVTWESFTPGSFAREVDVARSPLPVTPTSFGTPVKVSSINYAGTFDVPVFGSFNGSSFVQLIQGRIMEGEHPELAIGKGPENTGALYVTWNDGANEVPDVHSLFGFYHFTDILLAASVDAGNTWSQAVRVNDNVEDGSAQHPFSDQFQPAVATDKTGHIGVCFYDRRNDPLNFLVGRYCAISNDGKKWKNIAIDPRGTGSEVNQDDFALQDWRGDYDTLTTDALNQSAGFIGGYTDTSTGYQNVRRNKIRLEDDN